MQYVKGKDVQPLKDTQWKECKASTCALIDTMVKLFCKKNPHFDDNSIDATNGNQPLMKNIDIDDRSKETDLLFFTNNKENPSFLHTLSPNYSPPTPLANLNSFSSGSGFQVYSAMERGSSHPFHSHDAAWLGQVAGSRLWYFLPPNTPRKAVGRKVNGCDYLLGRVTMPEGATARV